MSGHSEISATGRIKKKRIRAGLIAALLLFACLSLAGCSFSHEGPASIPILGGPLGKMIWMFLTGPAEATHSMMETVLDTSYIQTIQGSMLLGSGASNAANLPIASSLWAAVRTVFEIVKPVGLALCTTFFIISLISMASKDTMTLEHYIKAGIRYMVAVAIISNLIFIMNAFMKISDSISSKVTTAPNVTVDSNNAWQILLGSNNIMRYVTMEDKVWEPQVQYIGGGSVHNMFSGNDFLETLYGENDVGDTRHIIRNMHQLAVDGAINFSGKGLDKYEKSGSPFTRQQFPDADDDLTWYGSNGDWKFVLVGMISFGIGVANEYSPKYVQTNSCGMYGGLDANWYLCFLLTAVFAIVSFVARIAAYFAMAQRFLDIGWRAAMAPIGCSNLFDGGLLGTPGVRYLRTFFAACLSGVLLVIVLKVGTEMSNGIMAKCAETWNSTAMMLALAIRLATVGAAIGIGNKVKEVLS